MKRHANANQRSYSEYTHAPTTVNLRKSDNTLTPPPQLCTHRLPRILRPKRCFLIFTRAAQQEIQTLRRRTPRHALDDFSLRVGLHRLVLHEALTDFVRHALELRVGETR